MKQSIAQIGVFYFAMVLKMAFGGFQLLIFLHSSLKYNDIVIPPQRDTNFLQVLGMDGLVDGERETNWWTYIKDYI